MPDHHDNLPADSGGPLALDMLIGRIVDGEASEAQRQQFELMAGREPDLWRRLALRQQDTAMLAVHIEPTLNAIERIELPTHEIESDDAVAGSIGSSTPAKRSSWWLAASGWAAVLALAAIWGSATMFNRVDSSGSADFAADQRLSAMSPEAHLKLYMQAPYVVGDMPPTLLQTDELPDGRIAVSYLRRIVEVKYFDSPDDIPLDADGNLSATPHQLASAGDRPLHKPRD